MSAEDNQTDATGDRCSAIREAVPSCSASDSDLTMQLWRFQRLALHTVTVQRFADHLQVEFAPGFPRQALEEVLAVERQCCPFFLFEFDEASRRLRVGVQDTHQAAALEVLAEQFSSGKYIRDS